MIVLMAGLPGSGKTTLAQELARRRSGRVLSKDEFRHALFTPQEIEYATHQDDFCQELMLQTAGYLLDQGPAKVIFLGGRPIIKHKQIENVIMACAALEQPWRILECVCSDQSVRQRLAGDTSRGMHPARNRDYQLYLAVKERFEAITVPKTVIDTDLEMEVCAREALRVIPDQGMD